MKKIEPGQLCLYGIGDKVTKVHMVECVEEDAVWTMCGRLISTRPYWQGFANLGKFERDASLTCKSCRKHMGLK